MLLLAMFFTSSGGPLFVSPAHAQGGPAAVGFVLDAGDVRFIFRQIQIAEAHAAGGELFGFGPNQVPDVRVPYGLRTVDGSFNHLLTGQTLFGASDQVFPRMTAPRFRDAEVFDPDGPGPAPAVPTSYTQNNGVVSDPQPRVISNLIIDQTVRNPAAVAVAGPDALTDPLGTLVTPNVAPDAGLSAPFNSMFTFFGQFFDHGLDLVKKGGSGTVFMPLQPDDPLFVEGSATNFMLLTRATHLPGPNGVLGDADDIKDAINQDTPFVDQNQTYTSHPSHQVFLREYVLNAQGRPVSTGRFIDGGGVVNGVPVRNIGNWGEVKAQAAAMLGIQLVDADMFNVPLLATDPYGRFLRGPNGFPMMILQDGTAVEGNPASPIPTTGARLTGHAFLDDIAHNAVPNAGLTPDEDTVAGPVNAPQPAGTYDDELLAAHFMTGDGRGNENIALTAVHTIFHAEHNRLRGYIDGLINTPGFLTPAEVAAWQAQAPQPATGSGWDYGERLFQAARFVTEMQYQHLVFEEFARKLSPSIDPFIGDGINMKSAADPAIPAEFAHQTYRLGHSMLTETIARTNQDDTRNDIPLLDGFLNPLEFNNGGPAGRLTAAEAAGAIFQGGIRQIGMEIDEFVTEAVRNNLLGLPLDLAALNIARGRSEGVAPLNSVRRDLFLQTSDPQLAPYTSWADFGFNIKHAESLTNFIAAYGIHSTLQAATTIADKRAAAEALVSDPNFMFADGTTTGVEDIDLWIGGLAERTAPFGGMLGTTFNHIFELTLENLQNEDRFYYLERLDGLNLLSQMEGNSFAELISRNTPLRGPSADVFARPEIVLNLATLLQTPGVITDDPTTPDNESAMPDLVLLPNGTLRYFGPLHVIWVGRPTAGDRVSSSEGDDTLIGDGGNDVMEGGAGNDNHIGGAGDDILTDTFGDDVMKGGPGNDAIFGGSGPFDLLQGNEGNDFIVAGPDATEVFGGPGNDIIYMGRGLSESIGGAGDDWMEGTDSPASIVIGDDNNQFQNDPNGGHDILVAGLGDTDFDAEGGDDIMVVTVLPTHRLEGMLGFDWGTYRGDPLPVDADMLITGAVAIAPDVNELRDRFDLVEGLSGWRNNDILRGDDRTAVELADGALGTVPDGHVLTAAGIARITGLAGLLPPGATEFRGGNIILGGAGSDLIEGRGGDDIIDGDRWLNVRLRATYNDGTVRRFDSLHEVKADVMAGLVNPGAFVFERTIVTDPPVAADCGTANPRNCDTAVFSGAQAEYTITRNADDTVTVAHVAPVGAVDDGIDTLFNIERLAFTDGTVPVENLLSLGSLAISDTTPAEDQLLTLTSNLDLANVNLSTLAFAFEALTAAGVWTEVGSGQAFAPTDAVVGLPLRAVATFQDNEPVPASHRVESTPTAAVSAVNDPATGAPALSDATPETGVPLSAGTVGIGDADGLGTFSFQWLANGVPIPGATGATFMPTTAQIGRQLSVQVTFTDLQGFAESTTSAASAPVAAPAVVLSTVTTLTASPAAFGAPITWTAVASGGTGALEYQFWRYRVGVGWTLAQAFSPSSTFTWTPVAADSGIYHIQVWVRSQGSGAPFDAWMNSAQLTVASPVAVSGVSANVLSPSVPGAPITWTAQATGGTGTLEYQFWRYQEGVGWSVVQAYSPSNAFTWTPTAAEAGAFHIQVWVRSQGSAAPYEGWANSVQMVVVASPLTVTGLTASAGSPSAVGTPVTWTATASGGTGPLQYLFWRYNGSAWTLAQAYSTSNTFTWTPTPGEAGTYHIQVWVRSANSLAALEGWRNSGAIVIQ